MPGKAAKVIITEKQQAILQEYAASRSVSVALSKRSKMILLAFEGLNNEEIELTVGIGHDQVGIWRRRWQTAWERMTAIECSGTILELRKEIQAVLADAPRSGRPPVITPKQQADLFAKACEDPQESGRPIGRWTAHELADELVSSGRIDRISSRWVSKLLSRAAIHPHRIKYWLFSKDKLTDPNFDAKVELVCQTYHDAIALYEQQGIHTICMDEMTGIQALERISPDYLVAPGQAPKREYEYCRHGTIGLFGNFHVPTGQLWCPLLRETRTEEDMLENVDNVISQDRDAGFCLVMDNLNTHCSESLVRYVAECIDYQDNLGRKGRRGILRSVKTRVKFLTNPAHRIRFVYTPRHCSWLNQIEIWFSTLRRKVTGAMSFSSQDNLSEWIEQFIDYYNNSHAKPYKWTYTGRVLAQ